MNSEETMTSRGAVIKCVGGSLKDGRNLFVQKSLELLLFHRSKRLSLFQTFLLSKYSVGERSAQCTLLTSPNFNSVKNTI